MLHWGEYTTSCVLAASCWVIVMKQIHTHTHARTHAHMHMYTHMCAHTHTHHLCNPICVVGTGHMEREPTESNPFQWIDTKGLHERTPHTCIALPVQCIAALYLYTTHTCTYVCIWYTLWYCVPQWDVLYVVSVCVCVCVCVVRVCMCCECVLHVWHVCKCVCVCVRVYTHKLHSHLTSEVRTVQNTICSRYKFTKLWEACNPSPLQWYHHCGETKGWDLQLLLHCIQVSDYSTVTPHTFGTVWGRSMCPL